MSSRHDQDGLGCLILLGLIVCVLIYNWVSEHLFIGLLVGGAILAGGIYLLVDHLNRREELFKAAKATIQQQSKALARRRSQTIFIGAYQEPIVSKWLNEQDHFFENVLIFSLPGANDPANVAKYRSDEKLRAFCFNLIAQVVRSEGKLLSGAEAISDPIEFERWCAETLEAQGWSARTTKGSGDQGADVIAERNGVRLVVQCKLYSRAVGNKAVQEAFSAKQFEGADIACVMTNAPYTPAARALAKQTGVLLLHRDDLLDADEAFGEPAAWIDLEGLPDHGEEESAEDEAIYFANESKKALEILLSRATRWQFQLVEELLNSRLTSLRDETDGVATLWKRRTRAQYELPEYFELVRTQLTQLVDQGPILSRCIEKDMLAALGLASAAADASSLLSAVKVFEGFCLQILDFEATLARIEPPLPFRAAHECIRGAGSSAVALFETFSGNWSAGLRRLETGNREFDVHLRIEVPELIRVLQELEKVDL